jgi:non-lysosomal glucosylceramidase
MRRVAAAIAATVAAIAPASAACPLYQGDLGNGNNLGPPVPSSVPADCAAACSADPACGAFTFTAPGAGACYLHPSAGTNVDSSSPYISGVCGGISDADFNASPFALVDAGGASGVPLGGIGVGWFDLAADGAIPRVAINNWHQDGVITDATATFLAVWRSGTGAAQLLQRRPSAAVPSLPPAPHTVFSGAFPTADVQVSAAATGAGASPLYRVRGWSPFIPHDVVNSSLPLAFIDVTVDNADGDADEPFAVALSWQDVIARRMFDASPAALDKYFPPPDGRGCGWATDSLRNAMASGGVDIQNSLPRVATAVAPTSAAGGALVGLAQGTADGGPLKPNKFTLQHYVDRVGLFVEPVPGDVVTVLPAWTASGNGSAGDAAWAPFAATGEFPSPPSFPPAPLFTPGGAEAASALAVRFVVPAGAARVVRFIVSWYAADSLVVTPGQDNRTFCGTGDYGKYYHSSFPSLEAVVSAAAAGRADMEAATVAWHAPILAAGAAGNPFFPPWLAYKTLNSAYTLFSNAILNRGGRFSMMEGGMGGLSGTMDQRLVAHIVYLKLFPSLELQELAQFGAAQDPGDGSISHFDADFYAGITGTDGVAPLGGQEYNDNSISWLAQVAQAYEATGDGAFLAAQAPRVPGVLAFLASLRTSPSYPALISGSNTYDDFWELPLDAYLCSLYPVGLEAAARIAAATGNESAAAAARAARDDATSQFAAALWNEVGGFYAYGAALDGSGRADDILFGGQVAGPFWARAAGWRDIGSAFNRTQAALAAQLRSQVAGAIGFYPAKVWNLTSGARAVDPRNGNPSSTWPFYLESYTALAAIQAGFVDDGLAVLSAIQLVDARLGLTWSRNLWNPGFITYVAAPVSWFALDVLAGAALNVPAQTLWLSPVVSPNTTAPALYPVFFPGAWATVTAAPAGVLGANATLTVAVTRVFDDLPPIVVTHVCAAPIGSAASGPSAVNVTLPAPFTFAAGAVLDLSQYYTALVAPMFQQRILPPEPVG